MVLLRKIHKIWCSSHSPPAEAMCWRSGGHDHSLLLQAASFVCTAMISRTFSSLPYGNTLSDQTNELHRVYLCDILCLISPSLDFTFKDVCAITNPSHRGSYSRPSDKACRCVTMKSLEPDIEAAQAKSPIPAYSGRVSFFMEQGLPGFRFLRTM